MLKMKKIMSINKIIKEPLEGENALVTGAAHVVLAPPL